MTLVIPALTTATEAKAFNKKVYKPHPDQTKVDPSLTMAVDVQNYTDRLIDFLLSQLASGGGNLLTYLSEASLLAEDLSSATLHPTGKKLYFVAEEGKLALYRLKRDTADSTSYPAKLSSGAHTFYNILTAASPVVSSGNVHFFSSISDLKAFNISDSSAHPSFKNFYVVLNPQTNTEAFASRIPRIYYLWRDNTEENEFGEASPANLRWLHVASNTPSVVEGVSGTEHIYIDWLHQLYLLLQGDSSTPETTDKEFYRLETEAARDAYFAENPTKLLPGIYVNIYNQPGNSYSLLKKAVSQAYSYKIVEAGGLIYILNPTGFALYSLGYEGFTTPITAGDDNEWFVKQDNRLFLSGSGISSLYIPSSVDEGKITGIPTSDYFPYLYNTADNQALSAALGARIVAGSTSLQVAYVINPGSDVTAPFVEQIIDLTTKGLTLPGTDGLGGVGSEAVWLAAGSKLIPAFSIANNTAITLPDSATPGGILCSGGKLFCFASGKIYIYQESNSSLLATLNISVGSFEGITDNYLYCTDGTNCYVISVATHSLVNTIPTTSRAFGTVGSLLNDGLFYIFGPELTVINDLTGQLIEKDSSIVFINQSAPITGTDGKIYMVGGSQELAIVEVDPKNGLYERMLDNSWKRRLPVKVTGAGGIPVEGIDRQARASILELATDIEALSAIVSGSALSTYESRYIFDSGASSDSAKKLYSTFTELSAACATDSRHKRIYLLTDLTIPLNTQVNWPGSTEFIEPFKSSWQLGFGLTCPGRSLTLEGNASMLNVTSFENITVKTTLSETLDESVAMFRYNLDWTQIHIDNCIFGNSRSTTHKRNLFEFSGTRTNVHIKNHSTIKQFSMIGGGTGAVDRHVNVDVFGMSNIEGFYASPNAITGQRGIYFELDGATNLQLGSLIFDLDSSRSKFSIFTVKHRSSQYINETKTIEPEIIGGVATYVVDFNLYTNLRAVITTTPFAIITRNRRVEAPATLRLINGSTGDKDMLLTEDWGWMLSGATPPTKLLSGKRMILGFEQQLTTATTDLLVTILKN